MNNSIGVIPLGNGWREMVLVALVGCCVPMVALAATTNDISLGSVAIAVDGDYVLTGSSASNTVTVSGGVTANIVLSNLTVDVRSISNACSFSIANNATVDLTLVGSNTLHSGERCAGLQVPEGTILVISSNSTGSLIAFGGWGGAGIGGGHVYSGGTIMISGGTVTANGSSGAGIGGGYGGAGGSITISGGVVTATGGGEGAGIGGGSDGAGGTITISGGRVTAVGSGAGAGIGGGYGGDGGSITISGGVVTAIGGSSDLVRGGGAGIGGGCGGAGGTITISGGTVTATGGSSYNLVRGGGAGIGGGGVGKYLPGGSAGTILISGGTVTATCGGWGAGIGGFSGSTNGTVEITGGSVKATGPAVPSDIAWAPTDGHGNAVYLVKLTNAVAVDGSESVTVEIQVDQVATPYIYRYAGSGHGSVTNDDASLYFYLPAGKTYTISVGTNIYTKTAGDILTGVMVDGVDVGEGSGEGWSFDGTILSIGSEGDYTISGESEWIRIAVSNGVSANVIMNDLRINVYMVRACAFSIASNATVNLTLLGSNILASGDVYAGLQVPEGATLVITTNSTGSLSARGSLDWSNTAGAGIGGSGGGTYFPGESCGTITIYGGTVTAAGAGAGAGIGGGGSFYASGGSGGTIAIYDGTVTTTAENGAGIGGGGSERSIGGSGGAISISGGMVTATCGRGGDDGQGAGIGGGRNGDGGTITISSGTVTARSYGRGAGIGGGESGAGGTITISGGIATADGGGGAGIGVGAGGAGGSITISDGTVKAASGGGSAGIGGGFGSVGTIMISGGMITATGGNSDGGTGIGGGALEVGWTITISGGTVVATAGADAYRAGIDSGAYGTIIITGGTITAIGSNEGSGIGAYEGGVGTVIISGGTVTATGVAGGAGIVGDTIVISDGTVTAIGGDNFDFDGGGPGIGCNSRGRIMISGGTVTAAGGNGIYGGSAGIGGGIDSSGGNITITGGKITATGGGDAAGIGGGVYGDGGEIVISNGTVTATGGNNGAGIGGGKDGSGGAVEISGGSVKAIGGAGAENIGSGSGGAESGSLTDGNGSPVYKVTVPGAADGVHLTTVSVPLAGGGSYEYSGYGHPSDTNLYFYLPNGIFVFDVAVSEIGSEEYAARVKSMSTTASLADSFSSYITSVVSDGSSLVFSIVPSNTVSEVLGTDTLLVNGDWEWQPVDYTLDPDGSIRIAIADSRPIIRVKFLP